MPDSLTTTAPRRLNPVPHTRVTFHAGFWAERTRVNREVTIPTQFQRLEEEGFIEVLDVDQPPKPLVRPINEYGLSMQMFFDSDFGKWIEAASYSLATHPDPAIEAKIAVSEMRSRTPLHVPVAAVIRAVCTAPVVGVSSVHQRTMALPAASTATRAKFA